MSFSVGNVRIMCFSAFSPKQVTQYQPLAFCWRDIKSSCDGYFPEVVTMFHVKKGFSKIKYGFEGSVSNVDLGLF